MEDSFKMNTERLEEMSFIKQSNLNVNMSLNPSLSSLPRLFIESLPPSIVDMKKNKTKPLSFIELLVWIVTALLFTCHSPPPTGSRPTLHIGQGLEKERDGALSSQPTISYFL